MEILKDIVLVFLQTVIVSGVSVLAKYGVDALIAAKDRINDKSQSEHIDNIIERVGTLVIDVVTETTQTYVDALKKDGKFNKEEQESAFKMSYDKVVEMMNDEYKDIIVTVFGNLQGYLTTQIENAVVLNKKV